MDVAGNAEVTTTQGPAGWDDSVGMPMCAAEDWAWQQIGAVDVGNQQLNQRVQQIAALIAAHPDPSLPNRWPILRRSKPPIGC